MYKKTEEYIVNPRSDVNGFEVIGRLKDDVHDLETRIIIDIYQFTITEAFCSEAGVPFPICHKGIEQLSGLIGQKVGPGLARAVRQTVMGPQGCTHAGELVLGSIKAFIQAASRETPEWVDSGYYDKRWEEWMGYYSDQCIYFSQPDISKSEIENMLFQNRSK